MSVLSVSINFVSRDIRIPSECLGNALLRYLPRYDSFSRRNGRVWKASWERSQKRSHTNIFVGFYLTPSLTSVPSSVFSFIPILIVEENVCLLRSTCQDRWNLLGSTC